MKTNGPRVLCLLACLCLPAASGRAAAAPKSDIAPQEKRRVAVDLGQHLAKPGELPTVPADLVSPFSPPDFAKPDPDEQPKPGVATPPVVSGGANSTSSASSASSKPSSARDVLNLLGPAIEGNATILLGSGERRLVVKGTIYKVGQMFSLTLDGAPYQLELTAVSEHDFTLRYQGELKTQPIKGTSSTPKK